jgi:hypothetical protein
MLVLALQPEVAAQARHYVRACAGTGTIVIVPCRARAVLFRVVPVPAHRAWPIWPSILTAETQPMRPSLSKRRVVLPKPLRNGGFL